jgi:hypothetical protein
MQYTLATLEDELINEKDKLLVQKNQERIKNTLTKTVKDIKGSELLKSNDPEFKDLLIPAGVGGILGYYLGGLGGLVVGSLLAGGTMYYYKRN